MTGSRDMTYANWARTVQRLRRNMAELREKYDVQCVEPPNFEVPPSKRLRPGGPVKGGPVIVGEHGPEWIDPIPGNSIERKP